MKKSTLITTIAMIVVVVVALSTATYAWFTNGTTNVAQDTMTTVAQSGWYLYGGSVASRSEATATIAYSESSTIDLHMMNAGLYAPSAQLSATLNAVDGNPLAATYADTKFFSANQDGFGVLNTADIDVPESYQHRDGSDQVDNLNAIRIFNGTTTNSACILTILVKVKNDADIDKALVAARNFKTFIVAGSNKFTNGYWYSTEVNSSTATKTSSSKEAVSSGVAYAPDLSGGAVTFTTAAGTEHFTDSGVTFAQGDQYYTITITLPVINAGTGLNTVFYAWVDGWATDNMGRGGTIDVVYAFGGEAVTVA